MQLSQYLLGINNIAQGDGARITLQNLIKGIVSTDENNLITLDSNGRLSVTAGAFNTDTGWATAPTITIDWSAGTVMGIGGVFYLGGVLVSALSNFIADNMPTDVGKHYLYYNTQTQALEWSTGYPTVQSDFVHHICEIVILADGNKFAIQTWGLGGTSESVIEYFKCCYRYTATKIPSYKPSKNRFGKLFSNPCYNKHRVNIYASKSSRRKCPRL